MQRSRFRHEAARSLSRLGQPSAGSTPLTLFARSSRVRAQQQRTFQWTGAKTLRQSAQTAVRPQAKEDVADEEQGWEEASFAQDPIPGSKMLSKDEGTQVYWQSDAKGQRRLLAEATPFKSIKKAHVAVLNALAQKAPPHYVLFVFLRAARCPGYLGSLNESLLKSIMDLIKPSVLLAPWKQVHKDLHPGVIRHHQHYTLEEIFEAYKDAVELMLRQNEEYFGKDKLKKTPRWKLRHLLEIAAATADGNQAFEIFEMLRSISKYHLNVDSYNKLLQAICWSDVHKTKERYKLRVTPTNLQHRSTERVRGGDGTVVGYQTGEGGIKDRVRSIVKQMQDGGHTPDAETWASVVIAWAREGDMEGVRSTIKSVWDVDTNAVRRQDDSGLLFENRLAPEAPTYPNDNTVHAIVHAFCINNDVTTALQIVDFFRRKYNVEVDTRTWEELLEWTFVLSSRRQGGKDSNLKAELKTGQLPVSSVKQMWEAISSAPYNVKLNMTIAHFLFKTHLRRGALSDALDMLHEADGMAGLSRRVSEKAKQVANAAAQAGHYPRQANLAYQVADLQSKKDWSRMVSHLRGLLSSYSSRRLKSNSRHWKFWYHRTIPDLIGRYPAYESIEGHAYSLPQGRVQFRYRTKSKLPLTLRVGNSPLTGVRLLQPPRFEGRHGWVGYTRQSRIQNRYIKRPAARPRAPLYQPQWFEKDDIRDWEPEEPEDEREQ